MRSILLAYDPDDVKPGWIALIIVLLLALATFLLWRSMNTQLGQIKVPKRGEVPHGRPHDTDARWASGTGCERTKMGSRAAIDRRQG